MSSIRRIESSRANGARSKGPKTPEGKARSSLNALRHGMLATVVVLPGESEEVFLQLFSGYVECLAPRNSVEYTLVEKMAAACWRERRGMAIEKTLLGEALNRQPAGNSFVRLTEAFKAAASAPELALIHRYETRLDRIYHRALHNLSLLRNGGLSPSVADSGSESVPPPKHPVPNEPKPISEPAANTDSKPRPIADIPAAASPTDDRPLTSPRHGCPSQPVRGLARRHRLYLNRSAPQTKPYNQRAGASRVRTVLPGVHRSAIALS